MLQIEKEKPVSFFWMLLLRSFPEFFPALRCLSPLNFRSRNSEFHSRFFSFHLDSQWIFFASFYIYSNSAEAEEFKHQNPSLLKHLRVQKRKLSARGLERKGERNHNIFYVVLSKLWRRYRFSSIFKFSFHEELGFWDLFLYICFHEYTSLVISFSIFILTTNVLIILKTQDTSRKNIVAV